MINLFFLALVGTLAFGGFLLLTQLTKSYKWRLLIFLPLCLPIATRNVFGDSQIGAFTLGTALWIALLGSLAVVRTNVNEPDPELSTTPQMRFFKIITWGLIAIIVSSAAVGTPNWEVFPWLAGAITLLLAQSQAHLGVLTASLVRRTLLMAFATSLLADLTAYFVGARFASEVSGAGRFQGLLGDYELTAEYYAIAYIVALGTTILDNDRRWRLAALAVCLAVLPLQLATQTRAAFFLIIVATVALPLGILILRGRRKVALRIVFILLVVMGGAVAARSTVMDSDLWKRVMQISGQSFAESINRAATWRYFTSLQSFRQFPWFGNGLPYDYGSIQTYPHSLYLWLRWTWGWAGLAVTIFLMAAAIWRSARATIAGSAQAWVCLVAVLAITGDQIKIEVARRPASVALFFMLLVWVVVTTKQQGEKHDGRS